MWESSSNQVGCLNSECGNYLSVSMMAPLGKIYNGFLYQTGFMLVVVYLIPDSVCTLQPKQQRLGFANQESRLRVHLVLFGTRSYCHWSIHRPIPNRQFHHTNPHAPPNMTLYIIYYYYSFCVKIS